MLTPNHVVIAARAVLLVGAATAAILMLGPFQGMEAIVGLTDKSAHAIAFGGLTAVSFAAFPRMRRSDLARAALILGGAAEVAQMFGGRSASLADWAADAVGILTVYGSSLIESARKMARDHGNLPFSAIKATSERSAGRRGNAVMTPIAASQGEHPGRFADRAARRFPRRDPV
ncbi:VanZ family protein [Caulobacter sp. ErkDOM-E]|uniref:VanZ family protein n=1 Tax=Caulobacter sp. ErkDOM-E TaxID=3402778 RepID=UPI003AF86DBB